MRVMNAPEGGQIWYCYECKGSWDSIELLARFHHKGDIRQAISAILEDTEYFIPHEQLRPWAVEEYIATHVAARHQIKEWSKESRGRWAEHKDLQAILAENIGIKVHLMESQDAASAGIGRWMHATFRDRIQEQLNSGLPPGLPQSTFRSCLAIPWSNALGRTTALWLVGWRKQARMWFPDSASHDKDPGLMLLDALPREPLRVIAVSSPYMALWLQYQHFKEDNKPAPVVCWHEDTNPAIWEQIGAQEVVLWDYEPSPGLFKQALHARSEVKVSFMENLIFDVTRAEKSIEHHETWKAMRGLIDVPRPSMQRIRDLTNRMREPYVAFRDYLFSLEPENVSAVLQVVDLAPDQVMRLLETCEDYDTRAKLERLLERTTRRREVQMFGGTVAQYIGPHEAYWALIRRGHEERLSDAVVQLDQCIRDEDNEESFYVGCVHHKGRRYPISASYKDLRYDCVGVIVKAIESQGGGTPFVSSSQGARLWDLVFRFSSIEKTVPAITRVGWDRDHLSFLFPRFAIRGGGLEARDTLGLTGDVLPGMRVEISDEPSPSDMDSWLEPTECNGTMWATLAALVDNIIGRVEKQQPRGIGLVGPLASKAGEKIASDLGMMTYNAERVRQQLPHFEKSQRDHDLPVLVMETDSRLKMPEVLSTWMMTPDPKNVLMALSAMQVATASLVGNWIVIDSGTDDGDYYRDSSVAGLLIHYLAYFQRITGRRLRAGSASRATLMEMQRWAEAVGTRDTEWVFQYARNSLQDSGRESVSARFVFLLAQMLRDGYLKRSYSQELTDKPYSPGVAIDTENERVIVSKHKVVDALARRRLPLLDTALVTNSLREDGALLGEVGSERSAWVIARSYWERHMKRWNSVYAGQV